MMLLNTMMMITSIYYCTNSPGEGGRLTAQGRRCDPTAMAAAHKTLPFGTVLNVCLGRRCIAVTINDRGPYVRGRDLDLTIGAAKRLGMVNMGVARVRIATPIPRSRPIEPEIIAYLP